jgi:hypothetical protein
VSDASIQTGATWPWPQSLDALLAAPDHHTLLFENDAVRVIHTCIASGDATPVHTHCWPCVLLIQSWSDCVRRDASGKILFDSRQHPAAPQLNVPTWQAALAPHSLQNVGTGDIDTIQVEIKLHGS